MNNNSERNYFDYATEQDITVKNKIDECRNWREKCKDLSTNQIFDKYLTIVKKYGVKL